MNIHETYMHRCIQLARLGKGQVAPNPLVGAVLVHQNRVIGEGYHALYGQGHAEVNCINSVAAADRWRIPAATLYVSLEPCAHFGKTPPCADLVIREGIRQVVIGCRDPFPAVNGKGIDRLQAAGIEVVSGVLEQECWQLNRRFFTFHTLHRPYIVLKWAQTANGKMSAGETDRLLITNRFTNRLVHRWRSEETAILVGTRTALADNPSLTNRFWHGQQPVRLLVDREEKVPSAAHLFNGKSPLVIFSGQRHTLDRHALFPDLPAAPAYYQLSADAELVPQVLNACHRLRLQSVLVEGGATLLQSFIHSGCWDEARVITNQQLLVNQGLQAPVLTQAVAWKQLQLQHDCIQYFIHQQPA